MDADSLDRIARGLAVPRARRTLVGLLFGGGLALAEPAPGTAKKCAFCQRRKRGKCQANPAKDGAFCAINRVCKKGRCVAFDQTCPAKGIEPDKPPVRCGPRDDNYDCTCYGRVTGDPFCADAIVCNNVVPCTTTTGCASNQVCVRASTSSCLTGTACGVPCPTV